MEHPRFKHHIGTTKVAAALWAAHSEEKDNLTDLRVFLCWLHDQSKGTENPGSSAVTAGTTLDEMAQIGETQAQLDSTKVAGDPMTHLPNPAEDASAMLKNTQAPNQTCQPPLPSSETKKAKTLADVKKQAEAKRQTQLSVYAKTAAAAPKPKSTTKSKAFEV